jgi:hypothetical protein
MNIFVLDSSPEKAAEYHCDKHVVKMILETCQLLSTAHRVLDGEVGVSNNGGSLKLADADMDTTLLRSTHTNHPCAVWVRESEANYRWTWRLLCALCDEYTARYGKRHTYDSHGYRETKHGAMYDERPTISDFSPSLVELLHFPPKNMRKRTRTGFAVCVPDDLKVPGDAVESYRAYYVRDKARFAKWRNGNVPEWFTAALARDLVPARKRVARVST